MYMERLLLHKRPRQVFYAVKSVSARLNILPINSVCL